MTVGNPLRPSLRAKRSNPWGYKKRMDCFVASLLAMTAGYSFAISPHVLREVWPARSALSNQRAQGMPDARCTRSLVCAMGSKYAHEDSQRVTGIIRHSPRNGLRLIPRSCVRKICQNVRTGGSHQPPVAGSEPVVLK